MTVAHRDALSPVLTDLMKVFKGLRGLMGVSHGRGKL
jgi:hypothetical protein